MLSLQHFPHKVVRLGLAGCALVAAAACTDHNVAGPPGLELRQVVSFDDLKAALVEARGEANGGFNLDMGAAVVDPHGLVVAGVVTGAPATDHGPGGPGIAAQ